VTTLAEVPAVAENRTSPCDCDERYREPPATILVRSHGANGASQIGFITRAGLKLSDRHRLSGRFLEYKNPVGVRAFGIVVHAPPVRGLGEFLVVDKHQYRSQTRFHAARHHRLFQFDLPENLANNALNSNRAYKRRFQSLFQRLIGNNFDWS